jgi:hypothetical protein
MKEDARSLPPAIRSHLLGLLKASGLPQTDLSLDEMARVWFEKKDMFESQVRALDMRTLDRFSADDPRASCS